jgi:hypothetical protein
MAKSPILGPFYVAATPNLADNQCMNWEISLVESKGASKEVGALYPTPGLTLKVTCGTGPIYNMQTMAGTLYVVSGTQVYSVSPALVATLIGTLPGGGPVMMMNNGTQMAIFNATGGFIVPGGVPLTGGTVSAGGAQYAVNDMIVLNKVGGTQTATAVITVTGVSSGAVTTFNVTTPGAFGVLSNPTGFTQASTSGSGAGFVMTAPTFGANVAVYQIQLPYSPVSGLIGADEQDGFGLINQPGTQTLWQSAELDFSIWPPLQFASASGDPDNVLAIRQNKLEMFVFKEQHTEIWYNAGTAGFIFQRLAGVYIELGLLAIGSIARLGENLAWLSVNAQGQGVVVECRGYEPARISTQALERIWAGYSTMTDAVAYTYQQNGHVYYVISFPSGNATWVYDKTASLEAGFPCWHQRAAFLNGQFGRHWSNCGTLFAGFDLVGDYRNGRIYAIDTSNYQDNGTPIKRLRSWRAKPQSQMEPQRFVSLQIDMMTGIGIPDSANPIGTLRWTDDGGHTFSNEKYALIGPPGATAQRIMYRRLGSTRRNSGLDRVFEFSVMDNFPAYIIGAELT